MLRSTRERRPEVSEPRHRVARSAEERLYRIAAAFQNFGGILLGWLDDIAPLIPNERLDAMEVALDDIRAALDATGWAALAWAIERDLR
jgi:hypothetical protein